MSAIDPWADAEHPIGGVILRSPKLVIGDGGLDVDPLRATLGAFTDGSVPRGDPNGKALDDGATLCFGIQRVA